MHVPECTNVQDMHATACRSQKSLEPEFWEPGMERGGEKPGKPRRSVELLASVTCSIFSRGEQAPLVPDGFISNHTKAASCQN